MEFFLKRFRKEKSAGTYNPAQRHSSQYHKNRRADKKQRGECFNCKNPSRPGLTRCDNCSLRNRLYRLNLDEEQTARAVEAVQAFDGRCECCGTTEPKGNGWCLDHDHKTKKFRGILCQNCNAMLGGARDCVIILLKAINYLRRRIL